MSDLERARRLPVFVDEDQWRRAFEAAKREVDVLIATGYLVIPEGSGPVTRLGVATRVATAALRAAAEEDDGDISQMPGVRIDEIGSHTSKPQDRVFPPSPQRE